MSFHILMTNEIERNNHVFELMVRAIVVHSVDIAVAPRWAAMRKWCAVGYCSQMNDPLYHKLVCDYPRATG